jgi:hypothetical protein
VSQPDAPDRPELLKLYELTLQEYRFQVLLNWDRMKNVFVVDGVLVGAAAGIWKLGSASAPSSVVAWILLLAALNSLLGVSGSRTGHAYYRETRKVKEALEKALGLPHHGFALTVTAGMREGHEPHTIPLKPGNKFTRWATRVTTYMETVLIVVAIMSTVEAICILTGHQGS